MRCKLGDHGVARPGVDTIAALREVSWPKSTAVVQALGPAGGRRTQRPTPEDNGTYALFRCCINFSNVGLCFAGGRGRPCAAEP